LEAAMDDRDYVRKKWNKKCGGWMFEKKRR
jgi:hypothetical protein